MFDAEAHLLPPLTMPFDGCAVDFTFHVKRLLSRELGSASAAPMSPVVMLVSCIRVWGNHAFF